MEKSFRPLHMFVAIAALVAALATAAFAIQDLWTYQRQLAKGYTEWATTSEGLWQLACGIAETALTVALLYVFVRAGRRSPDRAVVI